MPTSISPKCRQNKVTCLQQAGLQLFVAIDRTCKLAYAERHTDKKKMTAVQFLRNVIAALPYKIHTLLTDNGAQFTHRKQDKPASMRLFDRVCQEHDIEHRLTKINHPWTNGQVERMNRTIKEATVKRYHYSAHEQLKTHLPAAGRPAGFPEGVQFRQTSKHLKRVYTL